MHIAVTGKIEKKKIVIQSGIILLNPIIDNKAINIMVEIYEIFSLKKLLAKYIIPNVAIISKE